MNASWKFITAIPDGEYFQINGLNIWDHKWESKGEKIQVKDPVYGETHSMDVYQIEKDNLKIRFAAGEFSNCIWGIYREEENYNNL